MGDKKKGNIVADANTARQLRRAEDRVAKLVLFLRIITYMYLDLVPRGSHAHGGGPTIFDDPSSKSGFTIDPRVILRKVVTSKKKDFDAMYDFYSQPRYKKLGFGTANYIRYLLENDLKEQPPSDGVAEEKLLLPLDDLNDAELLEYIERRAENSSAVATGLVELGSRFATAADPTGPSSTPHDITPAQMEGWRAVNAVKSRENRANATPEQAAVQSQQATKRAAAWRERMTPEEREAYNAKAADRMKRKRASAKEPHP